MIQWVNLTPGESRSSITTAILFVPAGMPDQESAGDTSSPLHPYRAGIVSPPMNPADETIIRCSLVFPAIPGFPVIHPDARIRPASAIRRRMLSPGEGFIQPI
jgi:hypothetical protein